MSRLRVIFYKLSSSKLFSQPIADTFCFFRPAGTSLFISLGNCIGSRRLLTQYVKKAGQKVKSAISEKKEFVNT